jgi:hypothetical protein
MGLTPTAIIDMLKFHIIPSKKARAQFSALFPSTGITGNFQQNRWIFL